MPLSIRFRRWILAGLVLVMTLNQLAHHHREFWDQQESPSTMEQAVLLSSLSRVSEHKSLTIEAPSSATADTINGVPKILWLYWDQGLKHLEELGLSASPNKYQADYACVKAWELLHPTWDIRIVDQAQAMQLAPKFARLASIRRNDTAVDESKICQTKLSNMFRVEVLSLYGGVYTDTSICPIRPLDDFLPQLVDPNGFYVPHLFNVAGAMNRWQLAQFERCNIHGSTAPSSYHGSMKKKPELAESARMFSNFFMVAPPGHFLMQRLGQAYFTQLLETARSIPDNVDVCDHLPYFIFHCTFIRTLLRDPQVEQRWVDFRNWVQRDNGEHMGEGICFGGSKHSKISRNINHTLTKCPAVKKQTGRFLDYVKSRAYLNDIQTRPWERKHNNTPNAQSSSLSWDTNQQDIRAHQNKSMVPHPKLLAHQDNNTVTAAIGKHWILPNVLLAGVPKAGTTAIYAYLKKHFGTKDFSMPTEDRPLCLSRPVSQHTDKEPHFFDSFYDKGVSFYSSLYEHCTTASSSSSSSSSSSFRPLIVDATPDSFSRATHIGAFYHTFATRKQRRALKIIMVLREPMARELSWYHHMEYEYKHSVSADQRPFYTKTIESASSNPTMGNRSTTTLQTFHEHMETTVWPKLTNHSQPSPDPYAYALYAHWLQQWFVEFRRPQQILLIHYDELKRNARHAMRRIQDFLNLPPPPLHERRRHRLLVPYANVKRDPNLHTPSCSVKQEWLDRLEPYNQQLYQLVAENPGPAMEQRPFPHFTPPPSCQGGQGINETL